MGYAANKMPEEHTIRDCDDQWQLISGFLFHLAVNRCLFSSTASGLRDLTSGHQKPPWPSAQSARSIWTSQIKKARLGPHDNWKVACDRAGATYRIVTRLQATRNLPSSLLTGSHGWRGRTVTLLSCFLPRHHSSYSTHPYYLI